MKFLTPRQVADQLQVSPRQVQSLVRTGKLPAIDVGTGGKRSTLRIAPDALEDFLAGRTVAVPTKQSSNCKKWKPAHGVIEFYK